MCSIILVAIFHLTYAQNWNLINKAYKYNYIDNANEINTIRIDSVQVEGGDTIFYFNRIVIDCDTCPAYYNGYPQFAFYDIPQFFQEQVKKTDSTYFFSFPNQFTIKQKAKENQNWLFDTINNIQATILKESEEFIFDGLDSIKIIGLSTNDTIIISKKYGIIKFGSVYDENSYNLVGVNNVAGDSVPDFYDIFNFEIGDIFEYHGDKWQVESDRMNFIKKITIDSKRVIQDTVEYDISVKYLEWTGLHSNPSEYNSSLKFVNSPDHPTNKFNNELVEIKSYLENDWYDNYNYTVLKCVKNSNGLYTKSLGSSDSHDFFSIFDSTDKILIRNYDVWDEHEIKYTSGLGEVYHKIDGFEWNSLSELVGYIKGNDTVGIITKDYIIMDNKDIIVDNEFKIYPNPVSDKSIIELPDKNIEYQILIFNIQGQEVYNCFTKNNIEINHNDFKTGIYLYQISNSKNKIYTGKFIVK